MTTTRGRTVLVTGAGRGIGEAAARAFRAAGYRVGAYDLQPCAWAADLDGVVTGALDVTRPEDWERALTECTAGTDGALDVLVNNAGLLYGSPFVDGSYGQDKALVDVNVTGVLYGCRAAYPHLRRSRSPIVVNLCSASAIYGQSEMATYSATKFAVRGITEALDLEWADEGIRVTAVWPLYVPTAMLADVDTAGMRTMGVHLRAEDVASEIVDLASRPRPTGWRAALARVVGEPVHHPVGRQARSMYLASQVAPGRVLRLVNRRLTS